jgi:hypothetical protein
LSDDESLDDELSDDDSCADDFVDDGSVDNDLGDDELLDVDDRLPDEPDAPPDDESFPACTVEAATIQPGRTRARLIQANVLMLSPRSLAESSAA